VRSFGTHRVPGSDRFGNAEVSHQIIRPGVQGGKTNAGMDLYFFRSSELPNCSQIFSRAAMSWWTVMNTRFGCLRSIRIWPKNTGRFRYIFLWPAWPIISAHPLEGGSPLRSTPGGARDALFSRSFPRHLPLTRFIFASTMPCTFEPNMQIYKAW